MDKVKETIKRFEEFAKAEVGAAVKELEGIAMESNRKHLQRLVYVDLVNRFDAQVAQSMRLQIASIKSAQVFYTDLCKNLVLS